jgi:crotonobetainyl-CoA:carnitine CoA-transferase CaiB-like acyl-CoA transferase
MSYFNFPDMFQHRTFVGDETPWSPAFSPVVRTADGHIVLTPVSGAQMSRTLKALDRPDIKEQLRAITNPVEMVDVFYRHMNEILATKPSAHWLALFESFDLPVAPVRTLDEHLADPQVAHNRLYHEVATPSGPIRAVRYPASFDGALFKSETSVPAVDEHAEQIRAALSPDRGH